MTAVNPETGLLPAEQRVMDAAVELFAAWLELPVQHPDDVDDVRRAVHQVQDRLACRVARRNFPAWTNTAAVAT